MILFKRTLAKFTDKSLLRCFSTVTDALGRRLIELNI